MGEMFQASGDGEEAEQTFPAKSQGMVFSTHRVGEERGWVDFSCSLSWCDSADH